MPIFALILLFFSASMHALWNFLLKSSDEKYIAMGWQVILSGAFSLIFVFFTGLPPRSMWGFAIISMILEAIYFILLCIAYSDHDFSLVYPIARGAAPALLVLWSAIFLHEKLTAGGYIGLAMITGGIIVIGVTTLLHGNGEKPHLRGILTALSVALIISIYTFVDGTAVKNGPALPYGLSMFVMVPFVTTPYLARRYGWSHFANMWRKNRWYLLLGGVLGLVAYMLALFAYTFAPLSYSGAIREVSAVIGAFLGWRFLKEELGGVRVLGSAIVFMGVMVIAIFGVIPFTDFEPALSGAKPPKEPKRGTMADQIFPEPTVGTFIFNKAGELLLLKSHKWPNMYVVPGGHVELGESLEEAAIREAKEETGLDIYDLKFINIQEFIYDPSFWKKRHFIFFDYVCKADSLEVQLNDEAQEHVWVKLDAALQLPLDSYTRTSVEKIIKGNLS